MMEKCEKTWIPVRVNYHLSYAMIRCPDCGRVYGEIWREEFNFCPHCGKDRRLLVDA